MPLVIGPNCIFDGESVAASRKGGELSPLTENWLNCIGFQAW